jgi:hypothetical protein
MVRNRISMHIIEMIANLKSLGFSLLFCTLGRFGGKRFDDFPAVVRMTHFILLSPRLHLRGGNSQTPSEIEPESTSNILEIARADGPICLSDDSDIFQPSNETHDPSTVGRSVEDIPNVAASHESAIVGDDGLQLALSSSHRFAEVKEIAYEDPPSIHTRTHTYPHPHARARARTHAPNHR